jgi:acyl-CoA synthetase (AMP-forming)/AMP-acid ligase II
VIIANSAINGELNEVWVQVAAKRRVCEDSAMADFVTLHAQNPSLAERPAIIDDRPGQSPVVWNWKQLDEKSNQLANVLLELGLSSGSRVVSCGQNSASWLQMLHAARKIGVTNTFLNYRLTPEEATYVIDNCDATVVWVDAPYADLLAQIKHELPKITHVLVYDAALHGIAVPDAMLNADSLLSSASTAAPAEPAANDAATVIYTSGTTGKPKGAVRRGRGTPEQIAQSVAVYRWQGDYVYLTTGPLYHSGPSGFMSIGAALGNTTVVQHKFDAEDWMRLVDTYKVNSTFAAPAPIRIICSLPAEVKARYNTSSMKLMVANAAPWSMALKEKYLADFPEESLFEVYGSTEMGVNCILQPEDQRRKPGSCGQAAPGVEIVLLDDDGNVVEGIGPEHTGELCVRSAGMFETYHNAEAKYAEDERVGGYHTVGDIAYRDDEGYFYICDRKKDMIISGGVNIYPAEIEASLEAHPGVLDVAVFGIPSEEWGEAVHAVIVKQPGAELDEAAVIAYGREHLTSYKVPRSITFMDEIPRTGSGKILKRELRAPFWAGQSRMVG